VQAADRDLLLVRQYKERLDAEERERAEKLR
jgi:hypothetical protein